MSNLIYKKMSDVMKEIGHVGKDQKNQAQGFKFRGIDQFVNALYPALCKHGVFMTPRCTAERNELKDVERSSGKKGVDKHVTILMEYDFFAEDGSKVTVGPIPAEGLDSGDKATNKALSAALKYALIQAFSIPTEDMAEADLETPEIGTSSKKLDTVPKVETPKNNVMSIATKPSKDDVAKSVANAEKAANVTKSEPTAKEAVFAAQKAQVPKAKPPVAKTLSEGW